MSINVQVSSIPSVNILVSNSGNLLNLSPQGYTLHANTHISGGIDSIDHNYLLGLQGGQNNQYYHLTSGQFTNLNNQVVYTTGNQSISGNINISGNLTVDTNTFFVDAANNKVGIGTTTPTSKLTLSSGQIELPLGTGTAPSYTFNGDLDTGMFSASANTLNFATNGVLRLTIQPNGNVALPAAAYLVANNIVDFVSNTNGITMDNTKVSLVAGSAARLTAVITTGNIGIGTTSPLAKLHTIATTEQLRIGYDASNYTSTTVSSAGLVTLSAVGDSAGFAFGNTTRPTSAGTGVPAATSLITRADADARSVSTILGTNFVVSNSATRADTTMVLSLGVGTWELNGYFETTNAATGGAKIYIAVAGAQPESYNHRLIMISVNGGSSNPIFGSSTPAYGGGSSPFVFSRSLTSGAGSNFQLLPSVVVLTASATFTIGFSQDTAVASNTTLFSFSKFWANRISH